MEATLSSYAYPPGLLALPSQLGPEHAEGRPIRSDDLLHHSHFLRGIASRISFDRHFRPGLDLVRLESVANHPARRTRFKRPLLHLPVGPLHLEEKPGMRVLEPHVQ